MKQYQKLIIKALTNISETFYSQKTVKPKIIKYGERVFCYELYHQLRCLQKEFNDLDISGEVVKSHFQSTDILSKKSPDILIHKFGHNEDNEVIIEVKTNPHSFKKDIEKDFEILNAFTHEGNTFKYKLGISLVINCDFEQFIKENKEKARKLAELINENYRIELWNIKKPEYDKNKLLNKSSIKIYTTCDLHRMLKQNLSNNLAEI